jgi:hypothetical protein
MIIDVERPRVRMIQHVAREHLPGDQERERDDQPRERVADEGADLVDRQKQFLHGVVRSSKSATRTAPGWPTGDR